MDPRWLRKAQRDALLENPVSFLSTGFQSLITTSIPSIIHALGPVSCVMYGLRYELSFSDICIHNDGLHLSECFRHNLTYQIPIIATLRLSVKPLLEVDKKQPIELSSFRMPMFYLPIPTGPSLLRCSALEDPDPNSQAIDSGIFIIDGHMRTCPGTKAMINDTMLLIDSKTAFKVQIRSSHEGNRTIAEGNPFRGTSSMDIYISKESKRLFSEGAITCKLPCNGKLVQVGFLAQAFGCEISTFIQIMRCVSGCDYDPKLFHIYEIHILHRTPKVSSQAEALLALSRLIANGKDVIKTGINLLKTGINLLKTEIFPHLNIMYDKCDQEELYVLKVFYLAMVASMCILFAAGKVKETSRDLWQFATIVSPAARVGKLLKNKLKEHKDHLVQLLRRKLHTNNKKPPEERVYPKLDDLWANWRLSGRIRGPIANGNFSPHGKFSSATQGITLSLVDNNEMAIMNQLQRNSASMRRTDGTNIGPRKLPKDAFRGPCGGHTPEGKQVGLVTSWACLTRLTIDIEDPKSLIWLVEQTLTPFLISIFDLILPRQQRQQQPPPPPPPTTTTTTTASSLNDVPHGGGQNQDTLSVELFKHVDVSQIDATWYIFINNCGVPTHFVRPTDVSSLTRRFREARRKACLPRHCFLRIIHNPRQIRVICEGGQVISPLIVLENLYKIKPDMSFRELITNGIVEYINVAEEYSICKIALNLDDLRHAVYNDRHHDITHMEFEPASFLGLVGASVVFATSQPGARTSYAIHQWKAIMSAGAKPFRGSITAYELMYNDAKLVHTRVASMAPMQKDGYGTEILCAILPDQHNQEDAFRNHKQASERGLFHALTTRYYLSEIHAPVVKTSERFEKPKNVLSKKDNFTYDAIDDDTGLPKKNYFIPGGHPICAKTRTVKRPYELTLPQPAYTSDASTSKQLQVSKRKKNASNDDENNNNNNNNNNNSSSNSNNIVPKKSGKPTPKNVNCRREVGVCTQHDESGIITDVDLFATAEGIGLRSSVVTSRIMDEGNKITNDAANKGTNSKNCSTKNMLWNVVTGEIPDIVIAPTSFISRMLMSTVLEGFIGHAITLNGDLQFGVDEQMFDGNATEKLKLAAEVFVKHGKKRNGGATMRCGKTGKLLRADVAELVIYYKPLVHLAEKKLQYRSKGPRHTQTRQPLTGRQKRGATRFGEQESAATTAQGASAVLLGRLRDLSDPFEIFVCSKCSTLASGNKFINYAWCSACERRDTVYIVKIAFIFLYNYYERLAMGHKTLIHIKPHNHRISENNASAIPTASLINVQ